MVKRVRATRTLLIGAGAAFVGMLFAAGPASAAPPAPPATFADGGDGYLNGTEVTGFNVTGTMPAGTDEVSVRLVTGASCHPDSTPTLENRLFEGVDYAVNATTYTTSFDISDATMTANNLAIFPENTAVCALTLVGNVDLSSGEVVYGSYGQSTNKPIKDTIVLAGTVSIIDPVSPDWLNLAESLASPNVGSPMGSIKGAWAKNATSDATGAEVYWSNATTNAAVTADCGPFPTGGTFAHTPSSLSNGGTTADQPLAKLCANAPNFAEGDEIAFNARWKDVAGNFSPVATTAAFPDGNLKKDTILPGAPDADLLGAPVAWNPPLKSGAGDTITSTDVINAGNDDDVWVSVAYTDSDIDFFDVTVSDGTNSITKRGDPLEQPQVFKGFDLTGFNNCGSGLNNPPTHTPHPSLGAPPAFPGQCISAKAVATDLAGNVNLPDAAAPDTVTTDDKDLGFKDSRLPAAPTATWFPSTIVDVNDQLTTLQVVGEPYATVSVEVIDEDPSSVNLSNSGSGTLTRFRLDEDGLGTIRVDVTTMSDGTLTAKVKLTDPWGNTGPEITKTATKTLTTPSLVLTSPAANSMNRGTVSFSGIAKYNNIACGGCQVTIYDHPGNITNYGNPNNIPLVTTTTNAQGAFTASYHWNTSQVRRVFFRATDLSNPANPINGRPSAVRQFSVDALVPSVAFTSSPNNNMPYLPGESVIVRGNATDDFSGLSGIELIVTRIDPITGLGQGRVQPTYTVAVVPGNQTNCSACPNGRSATWSYDLTMLPAGAYTVQAHSVDMAGNDSGLSQNYNFTKLG